MRQNSQFPADLVVFTEEIFSGKLYFLVQQRSQLRNNFLNSNPKWNPIWTKRTFKMMFSEQNYIVGFIIMRSITWKNSIS